SCDCALHTCGGAVATRRCAWVRPGEVRGPQDQKRPNSLIHRGPRLCLSLWGVAVPTSVRPTRTATTATCSWVWTDITSPACQAVRGTWWSLWTPAGSDGLFCVRVVAVSHGRRVHTVIDAPCFGRPVLLRWRKRTWSCPDPGCTKGTFTEQDELLAPPRGLLSRRACWWRSASCGPRTPPWLAGLASSGPPGTPCGRRSSHYLRPWPPMNPASKASPTCASTNTSGTTCPPSPSKMVGAHRGANRDGRPDPGLSPVPKPPPECRRPH